MTRIMQSICLIAILIVVLQDAYSFTIPVTTNMVKAQTKISMQAASFSPPTSTALQSTVAGSSSGKSFYQMYLKATDTLTTLFPLWTVLFAGLALIRYLLILC